MNEHTDPGINGTGGAQGRGSEPRLNALGTAGVVFWIIFSVGYGFLMGTGVSYTGGFIAGMLVFGLLLAWLFGWMFSKLFGDSRRTFNIVFVMVLFIGLLGQFAQLGIAAQNQRAIGTIQAANDRMTLGTVDMLDRAVAGEDIGDEAEDQLDQMLGVFEEVSGQVTGEERIMMEVSHQMLARIQKQMKRYNQALQRLEASGGVDPLTLETRQQIAERRKVIESFKSANEAFDQVYADLPTQMQTELENRGVSKANIRAYIRGMSEQSRIDMIRQMRQKDREIVEAMLGMLEIFDKSFDQWYVDTDGLVVFERDRDVDHFNYYFNMLNAAATDQVALQKQAAEQMRK